MTEEEHLATITVLIKNRQANVAKLNKLLTDNGHLIMARLGVNVNPYCTKKCLGMITIAVRTLSIREIKDLTKKINLLRGILAKATVMK